jgi:hypothetical protein
MSVRPFARVARSAPSARFARLAQVAGLSLLLATRAFADSPAPGFTLAPLAYPGAGLVATLPGGDVLAFDGLALTRHDASGALLQTLATFPGFVFGSFLVVDPSGTFAVLGESLNQEIFKVDLTGGGLTFLATLTFNFDAVFVDADTLVVSAAPCGFCGKTNLFRLDTDTGALVEFAEVTGPSGPLALDATGNLYYALQSDTFPAPPGSTDIWRFDAAEIDGATYLLDADATVVATGFDAGGDLVCDPATGDLYLAESSFTTGSSLLWRVGTTRATSQLVAESLAFTSIGNLEFHSGVAPAWFAPFQPEFGGTLRYTSTDFGSTFTRYAANPARPELALTGPGASGPGAFDVEVSGGPALGLALVLYGPQSLLAPVESGLVTGATAPLFSRLDPFSIVYGPLLALDGSGAASVGYVNPGTWVGIAGVQAIVVDPLLGVVGTSTLALL